MKNQSSRSESASDLTDRQEALFDVGDGGPPDALPPGTPRLRRANRRQIEFRACAWNDLLPEDHEARIVWSFVCSRSILETGLAIKVLQLEVHPATARG